MKHNNKNNKNEDKNKKIITISILLLLISIGFAYLTATIEMRGLGKVKGNFWQIYFENVELYKGTELVNTKPKTVGTTTRELEYSVNLSKGDTYKFFVDIVNATNLNAMISVVKDTNLTEEESKYLDYTITYADETPLEKSNLLPKKSKDTIVVTVSYKDDIEENSNKKFNITEKLHIEYRQANTMATVRKTTKPTITYDWNYYLNDTLQVTKEKYTYNEEITTLPIPTREHFTFIGWYTKPYGGTEITESTIIRESTTYYAHWG